MDLSKLEQSDAEIALMFSGGLDTMSAAYMLSNYFKCIHLLTFCNGICVGVERSQLRANELKLKFGEDKFKHSIIFMGGLFNEIRKSLKQNLKKYNSPLIFDLCCRLAMETATVIYCLENKVFYAADGNNPAQGTIFLQQLPYLNKADLFFRSYGIDFVHPVYFAETRFERTADLKRLGLRHGHRAFEAIGITSQLFNQPFCLWAPVAFFFTSWMRHFSLIEKYTLSLQKALEFRENREEIAHGYIKNYFENNNKKFYTIVLPATQKSFAVVRHFKEGGKYFEIIPTPRYPGCCGVAIKIPSDCLKEFREKLIKENIEWKLLM